MRSPKEAYRHRGRPAIIPSQRGILDPAHQFQPMTSDVAIHPQVAGLVEVPCGHPRGAFIAPLRPETELVVAESPPGPKLGEGTRR